MLPEAQRVKISVLHDKAEADRLAGQLENVAALFPGDHPLDLVADDLGARPTG